MDLSIYAVLCIIFGIFDIIYYRWYLFLWVLLFFFLFFCIMFLGDMIWN
jgi:hypothetical protein